MDYKVAIRTLTIINVEAPTKDKALELVKENLINSNQIKPNDPIEFEIIN